MSNDTDRSAASISEEEFMQLAKEVLGESGDLAAAIASQANPAPPANAAPPTAAHESSVPPATISQAQFAPIAPREESPGQGNLDMILDVTLKISVELGRTSMTIRDILSLTPGSVIELDRLAGEPVDILVNEKLIARGEVVVVDENFGVRITDIVSPSKRIASFK